MEWIVPAALLLLAAILAGHGAVQMAGGSRAPDGDSEAGTSRAVLALVLLGSALGLGAVGAVLLSAGAAAIVQAAVFLAAVATVILPVAAVLLRTRSGRR